MRKGIVSDMNRMTPIPFTEVRIDDPFWNDRLRINREVSIPYQLEQCRVTGRIDAFKLQWKPGQGEPPHIFWDSDVAKWVEAASYSLATHPDEKLARELDEVARLIASAQQPDGYLNTHYTQVEKDRRWSNLRDKHELYCAGHLIEAAVAHFQTTGNRVLLNMACRFADYIGQVFRRGEGQKRGYCGHPEIELALVKLARATGDGRYMALARYFVEERGQTPSYFEIEAQARGEAWELPWGGLEYCQAHQPATEQAEAVGHAVRALYFYCGIADVALECGDPALLLASQALWENVTGRKMYVTGGVGSVKDGEKFGPGYDLPNESAYCETCASVANVLWNHRLLQLDCDGKFADVIERALYNGVISGVSLDGTRFFYENPLASRGGHHRQPWFGCACCPSNLSRLLASLGGYVFSRDESGFAVHLYMQSELKRQQIAGSAAGLKIETRYPWDGAVKITPDVDGPVEFTLRLHIPGWARDCRVRIGGESVEARVEKGYAVLRRTWRPGEAVEVEFEMPVERVEANPAVLVDQGRLALQRGPLVYCVEDANNDAGAFNLLLPRAGELEARWKPELLGGVVVIEGPVKVRTGDAFGSALYRPAQAPALTDARLKAVPYYAWDNQAPGAMAVWLPSV